MRELEITGKKIQKMFEAVSLIASPKESVGFSRKVLKAIKHRFTSNKKISDNKPISTEGSRLFSGRFHFKGTHQTLYFAESSITMDAEIKLDEIQMPYSIWPVDINLQNCVDLSNPVAVFQDHYIWLPWILNYEWKLFNDVFLLNSYSQMIGSKLYAQGYEGILVPSARCQSGLNVVVFPENLRRGSSISLHGDAKDLREKNRILLKNQSIRSKIKR